MGSDNKEPDTPSGGVAPRLEPATVDTTTKQIVVMAATCCGSIFGSCAASMLCKACGCSCVATQKMTSGLYLMILMLFTFLALIFRYDGGDLVIGGSYNATAERSIIQRMERHTTQGAFDWWNDRFYCKDAHPDGLIICCADRCGCVFAVYRFSFTLCVFFAFLT